MVRTAVAAPFGDDADHRPIEMLELSVRAYNCLKRSNIDTIGKLLSLSMDELLSVRNFGMHSVEETRDKLIEFGIMTAAEPRGPFRQPVVFAPMPTTLPAAVQSSQKIAEEQSMRAEILSIGTEILLGHIVDTNAPYLARHLASLGIDLYFVSQVGDNQGRVTQTLHQAWERADIIVTTGGLGPTEDDVTREAICALLGETPTVNEDYLHQLRAFFRARGVEMPASNAKQAWTIPSATILPNPRGTAPGWFVVKDGHTIISMPGVPREMERMWEEEAMPRILAQSGMTLFTRILRVTGLGESTVEERLGDLIHQNNPTLATYAKNDAVDVRISAKAPTRSEAEALVAPAEAEARQRLGPAVFGVDKETLPGVVGQRLQQLGWSIATLESCTGGLLTSVLTDVPGSSAYVRGGIVTYATDIKEAMGVPDAIIAQHGVISDETALAMAEAARQRLSADLGVGITGVAGPETQDDKPVGEVHLAITSPRGTEVRALQLGRWDRNEIKRRAVNAALALLWRHLDDAGEQDD